MAILTWIGSLAVLLFGAVMLNVIGQSLEGRDSTFIHFGWMTVIVLVGGALFPIWGWTSTGWLLGVAAAWSIIPPLADRLLGRKVPSGFVYHGDPHDSGDSEHDDKPHKDSGGQPRA